MTGIRSNPILKPEAAEAVKKYTELVVSGTVAPDLHNTCWLEPPPFVMNQPQHPCTRQGSS